MHLGFWVPIGSVTDGGFSLASLTVSRNCRNTCAALTLPSLCSYITLRGWETKRWRGWGQKRLYLQSVTWSSTKHASSMDKKWKFYVQTTWVPSLGT